MEVNSNRKILILFSNVTIIIKTTFDGVLCEESSVGDDEPVAVPCPPSADPSLLDLESAIFL